MSDEHAANGPTVGEVNRLVLRVRDEMHTLRAKIDVDRDYDARQRLEAVDRVAHQLHDLALKVTSQGETMAATTAKLAMIGAGSGIVAAGILRFLFK